jgi:hypothetical protein
VWGIIAPDFAYIVCKFIPQAIKKAPYLGCLNLT